MFYDVTRSAHNSESSASGTPCPSKALVTRRSWLANLTWAEFPTHTRADVSKFAHVDHTDSVVPGVGDLSQRGGVPSHQVPLVGQLEKISHFTPHQLLRPSGEPVPDPVQLMVLQDFLRVHGFRLYQLIFFCLSVLTYVSDIGSDAYLVYSYHKRGNYYWSYLTLALLIIPAVVMTTFSLVWYVLDRKLNVEPPRTCRAWTLRLFFHGLQLAPLVRLADAVYYGIVSRRANMSLLLAVHYTKLMLYEDADSAMLRMIECFMEAAPQLLLQLYILFTQETPNHKFQVAAQAVSCFTSWFSLAWSLTHYQSALRSSRVEKANLTWLSSALFFGWKAGMLASRIVALAMFSSVVHVILFGLFVGLHWLLAVSGIMARGTTFCSPSPRTPVEYLFDTVLGAVYCFDVVNVREGHSRLWYLACYSVIGLENLSMTIIWFAFPPGEHTQSWLRRPPNWSPWVRHLPDWVLPMLVISTFMFGLFMMLAYYLFAHPSANIKLWVPCDILMGCAAVPQSDIPKPDGIPFNSTTPVSDEHPVV